MMPVMGALAILLVRLMLLHLRARDKDKGALRVRARAKDKVLPTMGMIWVVISYQLIIGRAK